MNTTNIDKWFPIEQQKKYISQIKGRIGVTHRRAEYFVKLWAYLLLKQQQELGKFSQSPLEELSLPDGFVPCTHREAQELFYGDQDKGSDRAAGMMIDKLVALGLIDKNFDGNTTCIRILSALPSFQEVEKINEALQLFPDDFNPRTDAIPVANFLSQHYNWMNKKIVAVPQRIARVIRTWSAQYPTGMRVLRRSDNQEAVAFYALYPIARDSEEKFFLPPSRSLHLSTTNETDPIKMATAGDINCTSLFVRSCQIDFRYRSHVNLCQQLEDAQNTLIKMQKDFPNLCDMYTLAISPYTEELAAAVGFQKTSQDPQLPLYWMYMALDNYLGLDIDKSLSYLKSSHCLQ
ncbi:hypothetical protein [Calothrix sp. 336/3]|uniref:hypothetical protein n=1 Tax=Calothrix sp. 336/3 TaxID=1337936 RepID=UPI0004E30137|nr:hypothetical protein [Calothrix sp. 336/3]AKG22575.1 hypothetical protein IJ00_16030 [Calothrix sp. 336/3]